MFETGSEDKLKKPFGAIEYSSTRIENRTGKGRAACFFVGCTTLSRKDTVQAVSLRFGRKEKANVL